MKVAMVARDAAPSRALGLVKNALLGRVVSVSSHIDLQTPLVNPLDKILDDVRDSNLLVLGMSCSPELAEEEISAAKGALSAGVPFGFYADLFGTSSRAWFATFREKARFVFVMSEEEAVMTRRIFPNAEVVASGNPILEGAFFVSRPAAETRSLLRVGSEDLMIYCTAGKDLEANRAHFKGVVEAIWRLAEQSHWIVFFMLHPKDKNDPSSYADFAQVEGVDARVVTVNEMKALDLTFLEAIAACDIMVASVSTSGVEAACLRKPVVDFLPPIVVQRMIEQTSSDVWPPCKFGVSRLVMGDPDELTLAIRDLMFGDGFRAMRARQEACFPVPQVRGAAVKTMTETLLKMLV